MVLVNPPDLLIEIPVWQNYSQVHKILFSKDLDFISFFHNQQSKVGTAFFGPVQSVRSQTVKLEGPNDRKSTYMYQTGRSKRIKVDGLRKCEVLK